MRVVIVWRDNTDYARGVTEWMYGFQRRTGKSLESLDPDSREGAEFARLYDVLRYPTIVALSSDGRELQRWDAEFLPTFDDVSYYLQG